MKTQTPSPIRLYQPPAAKPKPSQATRRTSPILDDAEVADISRRDAKLFLEELKLQDRLSNIRNERRKLWYMVANGSDLEAVESACSLCGMELCVCERLS